MKLNISVIDGRNLYSSSDLENHLDLDCEEINDLFTIWLSEINIGEEKIEVFQILVHFNNSEHDTRCICKNSNLMQLVQKRQDQINS